MENLKAAWILNEMADLLELKGEHPYKILAYRKGANILEGLREPLPLILEENRLLDLPGIGKTLARDIKEIIKKGYCTLHQELNQELPQGLVEMLKVPGIGPKKALLFYRELDIVDIDSLEKAAKGKRLRGLKGIGAKTEFQIRSAIDSYRLRTGKILLQQGLKAGEMLVEKLKKQISIHDASLVGGIRRREDLVEVVELLIGGEEVDKILKSFQLLPAMKEFKLGDGNTLQILFHGGLRFLITVVTPREYLWKLHRLTGSPKHLSLLEGWAKGKGISYSNPMIEISSEEDIYRHLGLPYIIPELRQGEGEIQAASLGSLPKSIEPSSIKGDLHVHTSFSDGGHTLEQMVEGAIDRGYSYMAICDHSPSLKIAKGLPLHRLKGQMDRIEELQGIYAPFTILKGVEVDILADGRLDHPDEVLSMMDVVVASIHTHFKQDRETLTRRLLQAIKNPYVHIIGHPTGRVLGYRDPYPVDMDQILEAALTYGKIIEINVAPDRLDLSDDYIKRAKDLGIKLAINTDAHAVEHLHYMEMGVAYARRGYLEARDVLNTYPLDGLLSILSREVDIIGG